MKVPRTTWFPRSRRKPRRSRGPNCEDASDSATRRIENVTPATVIMEPAIVDSSARAPSGSPAPYSHSVMPRSVSYSAPSAASTPCDSAMAPSVMSVGMNQ